MAKFSVGPLRRKSVHRNLPTRIPRRPVRGQLVLSLKPPARAWWRAIGRERLAQRRRRARIRMGVGALVISVMMVFGAGWISYDERLVIVDVSVHGASALDPEKVAATFQSSLHDGKYHLFSRSNIFFYPKSEIAASLVAELPRIKSVAIARESLLAQAVTVSLEERQPRFLWCLPAQAGLPVPAAGKAGDEHCFLMDEGGYIFAEARGEETEFEFRGGLVSTQPAIGQWFLRGNLQNVLQLLALLKGAGYEPSGAVVENERDFIVTIENGFYLKVSFGSDPGDVVRNLELIVASDTLRDNLDMLEYVDLRFGNRVYYQVK